MSNHCALLSITVGGLSQAGMHVAELENNGRSFAQLKAVRHAVPFTLKLDGEAQDKANVVLTEGKPGWIRIRNDDPIGYRFHWRVELGPWSKEDVAWIGPHRQFDLPLTLGRKEFQFVESGLVRSAHRDGSITLWHEPEGGLQAYAHPPQTYKLAATLNMFDGAWQDVVTTVGILFFLLVGIILSLLVNHVLPTQRKRVTTKQQLADLQGRLAGLGEVVESRILSLLRMEKERLRDELRDLSPWFPSSEEALPDLDARIAALTKRIDLAARAGEKLVRLQSESSLSETERSIINDRCQAVLRVTEHHAPSAKELETAEADLIVAGTVLAGGTQKPTPEMVRDLVERAKRVKGSTPERKGDDESSPLLDLLRKLSDGLPPPNDTYDPTRADFIRDAKDLCKAELALQFHHLFARNPDAGRWQQRLIDALTPGPNESVRRAEEIVREAEENITEEDIRADLHSSGARIEADPPKTFPYLLVWLRVRLPRPGADVASARKAFTCHWTVDGKKLEADDWAVVTYFESTPMSLREWVKSWFTKGTSMRSRELPVSVEIEDKGAPAPEGAAAHYLKIAPHVLTVEQPKEYAQSRTWLSIGALAVTFVVVAIGLLTLARDQIQALNWASAIVLIVGLGYAADYLKKQMAKS